MSLKPSHLLLFTILTAGCAVDHPLANPIETETDQGVEEDTSVIETGVDGDLGDNGAERDMRVPDTTPLLDMGPDMPPIADAGPDVPCTIGACLTCTPGPTMPTTDMACSECAALEGPSFNDTHTFVVTCPRTVTECTGLGECAASTLESCGCVKTDVVECGACQRTSLGGCVPVDDGTVCGSGDQPNRCFGGICSANCGLVNRGNCSSQCTGTCSGYRTPRFSGGYDYRAGGCGGWRLVARCYEQID